MKFIKTALTGLFLTINSFAANAGLITLGDSLSGGVVDGWQAIMVINENDAYTNASGGAELVTVESFNFTVGINRGQVTPFIVKINNATTNDFTIMAIGETRYSSIDYDSIGDFSFDFSSALSQFTLAAGDIIAPGFLDADINGNSAGSVIPFTPGNSLFLTGGGGNNGSGNLSQGLGNAPTFGAYTFVNGLGRNYSYNVSVDVQNIPEPSTLAIFALGMIGLASRRFKKKS